MKVEELIKGQYYVASHTNAKYRYIFRDKSDKQEGSDFYYTYKIDYDDEYKHFSGSGCLDSRGNNSFNHYEPATQQEIAHFLACEKAGKFVECPKELTEHDFLIF